MVKYRSSTLCVEGLPAGGLLGDLGDLLQGEVAGGEERLVHLAHDVRLARQVVRRAAQTAKTNGSPVHSFHMLPEVVDLEAEARARRAGRRAARRRR